MPLKDDLHNFFDNHIREVKYFAYGLGVVGVVLIVRDLHLMRTFHHASEIPVRFVAANVTLQGRVHRVDSAGILHVQHLPVLNKPFHRWLKRLPYFQSDDPGHGDLLKVELAGVEMTGPSVLWLMENVPEKHIWFKLLQAHEHHVVTSVSMMKNPVMRDNLNELLVQRGLARVKPMRSCQDSLSSYPVTTSHNTTQPSPCRIPPCCELPNPTADTSISCENGPRSFVATSPASQNKTSCRQYVSSPCQHTYAFETLYLRLKAAENRAKRKRLGIWHDYKDESQSFSSWVNYISKPVKQAGRKVKEWMGKG